MHKFLSHILLVQVLFGAVACSKKVAESNLENTQYRSQNAFTATKDSVVMAGLTYIPTQLLENTTLIGNNTRIQAGFQRIFRNVELQGTWQNDTFALAWFVDGSNAVENFLALMQISRHNKVALLDRLYPIATPTPWPIMDYGGRIDITGVHPDTAGLILMTLHGGNNAYFNHPKGNSLRLNHISLHTKQSISNEPVSSDAYRLVSCQHNSLAPDAQPDIEELTIENCRIYGHVTLRYNGNTSDPLFIKKGIKNIRIIDNRFINTANFFTLSNASYDEAVIRRNHIIDHAGITFFFPIGGQGFDHGALADSRRVLYFENNTAKNTRAIAPIDKNYLSPIIAKGRDFIVKNNRIENQLTLQPNVGAYGFYCSASNVLYVENNYIRNCGGISTYEVINESSLLKLKGAKNAEIQNNEFIFDEEGLVLLGLLKPGQKASNVKAPFFKFSLWDHWKVPGLDSTTWLTVEGNTFKTAVLSDFTYLFNANLRVIKNKFLIDHFLEAPQDNWKQPSVRLPFTFFYLRSPIKNGHLEFRDNLFEVKSADGSPFYLTHNLNDDKSYNAVIYKNNVFDLPGPIALDILRTDMLLSENVARGKAFVLFRHPTTLNRDAFTRQQSISETVQTANSSRDGIINIRSHGKTVFLVKNPTSDEMTLMNMRFSDYQYYEENDSLPISLHLKISYKRNNRQQIHTYHLIMDKGGICYHKGSGNAVSNSPMVWSLKREHYKNEVEALKSTARGDVRLYLTSQSAGFSEHHHGFLVLERLWGVANLKIEAYTHPTVIANRKSQDLKKSIALESIFE